MNRIIKKLQETNGSSDKTRKLLSIYFTAGYPNLNDTRSIIEKLEESGVDMIEIGLPFSDPIADGPTIQESSTQALQNGMTTNVLFSQLENIRESLPSGKKGIDLPLLIMGYFNPIFQYGVEEFCKKCADIGIDGLIIPDLPVDVYHNEYQMIFEKYNLINIFLITPQTSEKRIRFIDSISNGFIYMVSSASTTGAISTFSDNQTNYFSKIEKMNLRTPQIVGFGISNKETFLQATKKSKGAIIGSAFVKFLNKNSIENIPTFIQNILK